jgi:alpha-glucan, water dikinase
MLISNAHTSHLLLDREISESELQQSSAPNTEADHTVSTVSLVKKKFLGKYAISAEEFSDEMVSYIAICI